MTIIHMKQNKEKARSKETMKNDSVFFLCSFNVLIFSLIHITYVFL